MKNLKMALVIIIGFLTIQLAMIGLWFIGGWDLMLMASVISILTVAVITPKLLA